jgi:hypothetical protein
MRHFIAICGFLMMSFASQAQAAILALIFGDKIASENFHISIDLGMNFSSLPGLQQQEGRNGFKYGLGSFIKLNDKWALTPEIKLLSPRGANNVKPMNDYSGTLTDVTYDLNLRYIDVPVLAQYRITPKLFTSAGPQISFLTRGRQEAKGKLPDGQTVTVQEDMKENFESLYFSVPLELGYSLHDARDGKGLNIKLRYNVGLSEVIAKPGYGSSRGSTFQVFLSLPFVLPQEKN